MSELESCKQEIDSLREREEIAQQRFQDVRMKIQSSVGPLLSIVDDLKENETKLNISQRSDLSANPPNLSIPLRRGFTGGGSDEHIDGDYKNVMGLSQKSSVCATQAQCEEEEDDDGNDGEDDESARDAGAKQRMWRWRAITPLMKRRPHRHMPMRGKTLKPLAETTTTMVQ